MRSLDRLLGATRGLSRVAVWVAGGLLILAAFMVTVDVILRKLFSISFGGADEITGYVFAIGTAWAFTFTLLERSNIRIDALYMLLPRRVRAALDLVAMLGLGVFMFFVTKGAFSVFYGSMGWPFGESEIWSVSVTPLVTPLAIPQGLWFFGLALFMFALALVLIRSALALFQGDLATPAQLAAPRSAEEEVREELHMAEAAHAERVAAARREDR